MEGVKMKAAAITVMLVLVAILIAACTKGNITGHAVQAADGTPDKSLGSGPDAPAGSNQSSEGCVMDGQDLNSIFSGRGSL